MAGVLYDLLNIKKRFQVKSPKAYFLFVGDGQSDPGCVGRWAAHHDLEISWLHFKFIVFIKWKLLMADMKMDGFGLPRAEWNSRKTFKFFHRPVDWGIQIVDV